MSSFMSSSSAARECNVQGCRQIALNTHVHCVGMSMQCCQQHFNAPLMWSRGKWWEDPGFALDDVANELDELDY